MKTYCKVTGLLVAHGQGFAGYKVKKIAPSKHPILEWSRAKMYDFLQHNYVKRGDTLERYLVVGYVLDNLLGVDFKSPLLLDVDKVSDQLQINSAFALAVKFLRDSYSLNNTSEGRHFLKHLPKYRVTSENYSSAQCLVDYLKTVNKKLEVMTTTSKTSDYSLEEDTLQFKLAILGLDSGSISDSQRLPTKMTHSIADWAAYHYSLATGGVTGDSDYMTVVKMLIGKVDANHLSRLEKIKAVMLDVLPLKGDDINLDKTKALLTLKEIDDRISKCVTDLTSALGIETQEENYSNSGVSWTIVTPKESVKTAKPVVPKPDKQQSTKGISLVQRLRMRRGIAQ